MIGFLWVLFDRISDLVQGLLGRLSRKPWALHDHPNAVHVEPVRDWIRHDLDSLDCVCGPTVTWSDRETGEAFARPLVVHFSLDGRENNE